MTVLTQSPNDTAIEIMGRPFISHTSISTYQQCPLKFYFRYVEHLPPETVSASLIFGSAIHAAAQLIFDEQLAGNGPPGIDRLLDTYQEFWRSEDLDLIKFGKSETRDSLGQLAERMLFALLNSDVTQPSGSIVGVEEELQGELIDGVPDLLAKLDLVVDEGDALAVTDLKTARSRWSLDQVEQNASQLLLYGELASRLLPAKPVKLRFAVVTKTKMPAVEVYDVPVHQHSVDRVKRTVTKVWQAIEAGHFYPAPSPMSCPGCPYRKACRAWQG